MPSAQPITMFDIRSGNIQAVSPGPWRVRYTLNYFSVSFRTEFLEFAEIEPRAISLGVSPTGKRPANGNDLYTVPFIIDPNTGVNLGDSYQIIPYIEKTYPHPSRPSLFPEGLTVDTLKGFEDAWNAVMRPFVGPRTYPQLSKEGQAYIIEANQPTTPAPVSSQPVATADPEKEWQERKVSLRGLVGVWKGKQGVWFAKANGELTALDFVVAGLLEQTKLILGANSHEWKDIVGLEDGFWTKIITAVGPYNTFH